MVQGSETVERDYEHRVRALIVNKAQREAAKQTITEFRSKVRFGQQRQQQQRVTAVHSMLYGEDAQSICEFSAQGEQKSRCDVW